MNLEAAIKFVESKLTDYALMKELNDEAYSIDMNFIEPMLVFLSQQTSAVPFGALVGAIIGSNQNRLEDALYFMEAIGAHGIVKIDKVNDNWIVYPVKIENEITPALGCDSRPVEVDLKEFFCGKTLHRPEPSRIDHIAHMNGIKFEVNQEFIEAYPDVPDSVPYKRTLPDLMKNTDSTIYIRHKPDTRGRFYSVSHFNYQGTEYEKCVLQFRKKLVLTDEGYANICDYLDTLKEDEEYLRFVACQALKNADKPTGIFIGADASASGIQLMSVLRGCEVSAESVGLTKINDFYTLAEMQSNLSVAENADPRKIFKQCCMQHFYGGTKTPREHLGEANLKKFYETLWKIAPGCQNLLNEIQSIYWATPVFKWTLPDGFKVQQAVIESRRVELSLPSKPNVKFGYSYKSLIAKDKGLELAANIVHSVDAYVARELIYRAHCGRVGEPEQLLSTLNNAINHSNDNSTNSSVFSLHKLMNTPVNKWSLLDKGFLNKAKAYLDKVDTMPSFDVIAVHDDFKCHPNYLQWVKFLYIEIIADIADSELIKEILEEVNPEIKYKYSRNTKLAEKIRTAYENSTGHGLQ